VQKAGRKFRPFRSALQQTIRREQPQLFRIVEMHFKPMIICVNFVTALRHPLVSTGGVC
jgi:hypothetical protein